MIWLHASTVAPYVLIVAASVPFTSIAKGDLSEQETARQAIARTPGEWQALWHDHSPAGKLPEVDFRREMVVGVFLGTEPSTGYEVEIVGVKTDAEGLVIEYAQREPTRGVMTAEILTQPFHLVAVPTYTGPVRFVRAADAAPPPAAREK